MGITCVLGLEGPQMEGIGSSSVRFASVPPNNFPGMYEIYLLARAGAMIKRLHRSKNSLSRRAFHRTIIIPISDTARRHSALRLEISATQ